MIRILSDEETLLGNKDIKILLASVYTLIKCLIKDKCCINSIRHYRKISLSIYVIKFNCFTPW